MHSSTKESLRLLLHHHAYFGMLPAESIDRLMSHATRSYYPRSTPIYAQGKASAGVKLVEDGNLKVFHQDPRQRSYIIHIRKRGDFVNITNVFDHAANPTHCAAITDAHLWRWTSKSMETLIAHDPSLAQSVLRRATNQLRDLITQIEHLALDTVLKRLVTLLLNEGDLIATGTINRTTLAAYLGTTPETVRRYLGQLAQLCAIQVDRREITLVQPHLVQHLIR